MIRNRCRRAAASLIAVAVGVLLAYPAAGAELVVMRQPVDAPIVDPFRLPNGPYGAGNRGIEYRTEPGDRVEAAGDGLVVFAGAVARTLHVTVDHGGVRSSYSFLDRIVVQVGEAIRAGELVGYAGERLHFGVRVGDEYVDPATFFGEQVIKVRLVAFDDSRVWRNYSDAIARTEAREFLDLAPAPDPSGTSATHAGPPSTLSRASIGSAAGWAAGSLLRQRSGGG